MLTQQQIAERVGVSQQAIAKRDLSQYVVGSALTSGRPVLLYSADVLKAFGCAVQPDAPASPAVKSTRATRSDSNKCRGLDERIESGIVEECRLRYLAQPMRKALRAVVSEVAGAAWGVLAPYFDAPEKAADYFYFNRLMRKDSYFTGYARRFPTWEQQWEQRWKKSDHALVNMPTVRYNLIDLAEDAGICGRGFGAATWWAVDDRTTDGFVYAPDRLGYKGEMPRAMWLIDVWTCRFLDVEWGEPSSYGLIKLLMRNVFRFGLPVMLSLENSRVMKNAKVDGAIEALYSESSIQQYRTKQVGIVQELFPGTDSPIVRNLPHIPRSPGKSRLERMFREIKAADALALPETYRDGGKDPVQLQLGTAPKAPLASHTLQHYWQQVEKWVNSNYTQALRAGLFAGAAERGIEPSIAGMWRYFGGEERPGTGALPDGERFALFLFYLADFRDESGNAVVYKTIVKAKPGRVSLKVDHREYTFVDPTLAHLREEKVAVVFVPNELGFMTERHGEPGNYAALFHVDGKKVQYLNIARDITVRKLGDAARSRTIVQQTRAQINNSTVSVVVPEVPEQPRITNKTAQKLLDL